MPQPKILEIKKLAIQLEEYDDLRKFGKVAEDLSQPAEDIRLVEDDVDIEATNYLLNQGYKSRNGVIKKKPKKRKDDYKVCDFVDTTKAVEGSSTEDEVDEMLKAKSKRAKEDLESEIPTESKN